MAKNKEKENKKIAWGTGYTESTKEQQEKQPEIGKEQQIQEKGTALKPIKPIKPGTIKKSGVFLYNELFNLTKKNKAEGTLYLWKGVKGMDGSDIKMGFDLSIAEQKAVYALYKMLKKRSTNNTDTESEDYYMGYGVYKKKKEDGSLVEVDKPFLKVEGRMMRMPIIKTNRTDFGKFYYGKESITGREYQIAESVLRGIARKNYPIVLEYDGKKRASYGKLIKWDEDLDSKEWTILLHPIYSEDIGKNYITFPGDLPYRLGAAYGHNHYPSGALDYAQHLIKLKSRDKGCGKKANIVRKLDGICNAIAPEKVQARKVKEAITMVREALEAYKAMGLLKSYSADEEDWRMYSTKVTLHLNTSFE